MQHELAFSVNGGLDAGARARRAVLAGDGAVPAFARDDVLLLITELVTNAVLHADVGPHRFLRLRIERWPRRVRVEVTHPGIAFEPDPAPADGTGGWGLLLVERIADRWGIASRAPGTCVWFEILA
jgi:anti-sigma regulatory factor (Ser/Thr protein kinase)